MKQHITELNISQNLLTDLPEQICELVHLKILDANDNRIKSLPVQIGELKNLRTLLLYKNKLTQLPDSIGNLAMCTNMNLFNNDIIRLPPTLSNLGNMEVRANIESQSPICHCPLNLPSAPRPLSLLRASALSRAKSLTHTRACIRNLMRRTTS